MKTPKEKANELVNQYRMILMDEDTDCGNEILCTLIAIKCALICVDEKLEVLNHLYHGDEKENSLIDKMKVYYNEVKKEIEKL